MEEVAREFGQHSDKLLRALQVLVELKPKFNHSGKTATYTLKEKDLPSSITFVKTGRFWYIKN